MSVTTDQAQSSYLHSSLPGEFSSRAKDATITYLWALYFLWITAHCLYEDMYDSLLMNVCTISPVLWKIDEAHYAVSLSIITYARRWPPHIYVGFAVDLNAKNPLNVATRLITCSVSNSRAWLKRLCAWRHQLSFFLSVHYHSTPAFDIWEYTTQYVPTGTAAGLSVSKHKLPLRRPTRPRMGRNTHVGFICAAAIADALS